MDMDDIRSRLASARYTTHAIDKMAERVLNTRIVAEAMDSTDATVIEEAVDARGSRWLAVGWWDDRQPLHILFGGSTEELCVISLWDPSQDPKARWTPPEFRTRASAT